MTTRAPSVTRVWGLLTAVDGSAPAGWSRPRPGRDGIRRDVLIGVCVALIVASAHWAIMGSGILNASDSLDTHQPVWMRLVFPAAFGVVVAVRRIFPVSALIVGTVVFLLSVSVMYLEQFVSPYVYFYILYSAGAWSARRTAVTVVRILITLLMLASTFVSLSALDGNAVEDLNIEQTASYGVWASIINVLFYVGAFWLGNSEYLRAGQRATMDAQFAELEVSHAQLADQAVRLDRLRIARELHDSVAHHVSLMGVQAAVARRTLELHTDAEAVPDSVVTAMEHVETSAREAVEELQSVLVTLRSEDDGPFSLWQDEADAAPSTRTLAQIPALIDRVRESGMPVAFHEYGTRADGIMSTVELTVYRVLQEALTNVRKHAGDSASVDVRIRHDADWIELDVTDDGLGIRAADSGTAAARSAAAAGSAAVTGSAGTTPVPALSDGGGRGILGMEERAQAVGGILRTGPRESGGFRVLLRVPTRGGGRLKATADVSADERRADDG